MMSDARHGQVRCCPGLAFRQDRPIGETLPRRPRRAKSSPDRVRQFSRKYRYRRPVGRAIVIIIGAVAELERNLIIERCAPVCGAPGSKASTSVAIRWYSTSRQSNETVSMARASERSPKAIASQRPPCSECFESCRSRYRCSTHLKISLKRPLLPCDTRVKNMAR